MARRVTPAQLQAAMRKAQREQKQAVDKYNRDARRHNAAVKKAVTDYNREVRAYNTKARAHNVKVENQRRRLNQEIRRLNSRPASTTFTAYRSSVEVFASSYEGAEERLAGQSLTATEQDLLNRSGDDAANSVYLLNAMDGDGAEADDPSEADLRRPSMAAELARFSQDLVDRWSGALFSLSPSNPDAARHFCTSAREVLISMLDTAAPDADVISTDPACERTDRGFPTRRAKVGYLLSRKGVTDASIRDIVQEDMNNVLNLFSTFNKGTHGHAGRFTITQLNAIRVRVESAIAFMHTICWT